jgi:hypothetical protein
MKQTDIVTKVLETVKQKGADAAEISYAKGVASVSVADRVRWIPLKTTRINP